MASNLKYVSEFDISQLSEDNYDIVYLLNAPDSIGDKDPDLPEQWVNESQLKGIVRIHWCNFRAVKLVRKKLQDIFAGSSLEFEKALLQFTKPKKSMTFPDILIDVSKCDDPRLLQNSLHLLNRYMQVFVATPSVSYL